MTHKVVEYVATTTTFTLTTEDTPTQHNTTHIWSRSQRAIVFLSQVAMANQTSLICIDPVSRDEVKDFSLAFGVPGTACLVLSLAGLAAELVFVCRHKNNFLLRLFIYLSVAVMLSVSTYAFLILLYVEQTRGYYQAVCEVNTGVLLYAVMVELFFIYSIDILLLQKVLRSVCKPYSKMQKFIRYTNSLSQRTWRILETLFITTNFTLPLILTAVNIAIVQDPAVWIPREVCATQFLDTDCYSWKNSTYLTSQYLLRVLIPGNGALVLSLVCVLTLILWLAWLRKWRMLRGKFKVLMKEMTLLLTYLISFCVFWILVLILQQVANDNQTALTVIYVLYPIRHVTTPTSFFVYLCVSFRQRRHSTRLISANKFQDGLTPHPSAPPSTRVSLPSDTDLHAPEFLSPIDEEPSEYSPLLVNLS